MALAALLACLILPVWLFGTTAGARKLLETVSRRTVVKISAEKIDGKMGGTIRLENLAIAWPQGEARIQYLVWTSDPLDLLAGRMNFQNLSAKNISVYDRSPDTPPDLKWPHAPLLIRFFSGTIHRLDISNLTYRHLEKEPLHFQTATATLAWKNAKLSVDNFRMVSEQGVVTGNVLAGFRRPLLEMDLTATPSQPLAGMDILRLRGKFGQGKSQDELAGNLNLSGDQHQKTLWQLAADAGMTAKGFPLQNVRLHRPGREGLITADGMLTMSGPLPFLDLRARAAGIDLFPEFKIPMNLSGSLTFAGTTEKYTGQFAMANQAKDWKTIRLAGNYSGNAQSLNLNATQGSALNGVLAGYLNIDWQNGLAIHTELSGRKLNPAAIDRSWDGVINFDLSGNILVPKQQPASGKITCALLQSQLHGQQLTGILRATFIEDDVKIERMALQGKGFQLTASGSVKNKVDFNTRISDLSRLIPQTSGSLAASGWTRWQNDRFSGVISAQAHGLKAYGLEITSANLNAVLADEKSSPLSMNATFNKLRYGGVTADALTMKAGGTLPAHTITAAVRRSGHDMQMALSGACSKGRWQGKIIRLDGTDSVGPWKLAAPAILDVTANSFSLEPLIITGRESETLRISGKLAPESFTGSLALDWKNLNLARANFWINRELLTGTSNGNILLKLLPEKRITLSGKLSAGGTIQAEDQSVNIRQSEITLNANENGIRAKAEIHLAQGGNFQGDFSSSSPAGLKLPDEGNFSLQWKEFDMTPYSAWLPGRTRLEGKMTGSARGNLLPNRRLSLTGQAALAESSVSWRGQRGDVKVKLRNASLQWIWQDETLGGTVTLNLAKYGKIQGVFRLPIAARFPVSMNTAGNLQASLTGRFREKGALSILFPELVQESHGELDVDLKMSGSWVEPQVMGTVRMTDAGGYLPSAGITLKDASISARLDKNAVHIDSFRAISGQGHVEGSALIRIKGRQIEGYEGQINGERFQTIYFPELQVQSSPKLTFYGTPDKLSVRGEVRLPDVQIVGSQSRGPVEASPDVVRKGKGKAKTNHQKLPIHLDVQVRMMLGDAVSFKASGIDAQLGGQIDLQFQELDKITGRGEIRVVKGRFRTYGVNLDIVRGRLFYAGGPVNQPTVDILALRKVGDVRAGVTVSGTLPNPLVKLYSEPFMQDMDILAYIVLGHPLGNSSEQAGLMAMAASALLTSQQSEKLQRQIKTRLGFDTFDISADVVKQNGYMGYKRINVTPDGKGTSSNAGSVSETMLVVGKYLTPDLYISYGRSLFSGGNLFFLRYNLSPKWQIETQTGQESGVDIYYKIEFN